MIKFIILGALTALVIFVYYGQGFSATFFGTLLAGLYSLYVCLPHLIYTEHVQALQVHTQGTPLDNSTVDDCLYIIIIGDSGSGKKSTIKSLVNNTILEHASGIKYSRNCDTYGRNVEAIVCESSSSKNAQEVEDNFRDVMKHQKKTHVIILCIPFDYNMGEEYKCYLDALKNVYESERDDIIKNNLIVVTTFGERFQNTKNEHGYKNFEHWKKMMESAHFKELILACNNRVVLFQNADADYVTRENQAYTLFELIDQITIENSKIINEKYAKVEVARSSPESYEHLNISLKNATSNTPKGSELQEIKVESFSNPKSAH